MAGKYERVRRAVAPQLDQIVRHLVLRPLKGRPAAPAATTWEKGDEAWVEFNNGTYKCTLVSRSVGVWTVKWDNGDEEPKTVRERLLGREAPTKRAKVEAKCFV